jgi:hypothetical protein
VCVYSSRAGNFQGRAQLRKESGFREMCLALARLILFSILENWASRRILDLDLSPTNCFIIPPAETSIAAFLVPEVKRNRNGMQKEESEAQRKQFSAV